MDGHTRTNAMTERHEGHNSVLDFVEETIFTEDTTIGQLKNKAL